MTAGPARTDVFSCFHLCSPGDRGLITGEVILFFGGRGLITGEVLANTFAMRMIRNPWSAANLRTWY